MNRPGRRNDRSVEQSGVSRKNRSGNLGNRPGFLCEKLCFILYVARSWHVWPWSAWPEDTNARQRKLNRLPTGYRWHERIPGGSELHEAWGLHKFMLQSEIFSHFIIVRVYAVACVRCFVHMHESWEGLRLFEKNSMMTTSKDIVAEKRKTKQTKALKESCLAISSQF